MTATTNALSSTSRKHLEEVAASFDAPAAELTGAARSYRRLLAGYYNLLIPAGTTVLEIGCGDGELLAHLRAARKTGVDISTAQLARARVRLPEATFVQQSGEELDLPGQTFDYIIVSDTLNFAADVEQLLARLHTVATPQTRLLINSHNNLWRPAFAIAGGLGLRSIQPQSSWLSCHDIANLLALAGWDTIKHQSRLLWPIRTPLLAPLLNRWLAPLFPWACCSIFTIARPRPLPIAPPPSVSVVIPARNEAGNIEAAILRTPEMGAWTELIFVEGNSTDNTWPRSSVYSRRIRSAASRSSSNPAAAKAMPCAMDTPSPRAMCS